MSLALFSVRRCVGYYSCSMFYLFWWMVLLLCMWCLGQHRRFFCPHISHAEKPLGPKFLLFNSPPTTNQKPISLLFPDGCDSRRPINLGRGFEIQGGSALWWALLRWSLWRQGLSPKNCAYCQNWPFFESHSPRAHKPCPPQVSSAQGGLGVGKDN